MMEDISRRQISYDEFFAKVTSEIKSFIFNPTNLQSAKNKFLRKGVSPQFEYQEVPDKNKMYQDVLESFCVHEKSGAKFVNDLLVNQHKELNKKLKLCSSVGKSSFTKSSISLYGKPKGSLIHKAEELLSNDYIPHKKTKIHSDEVIKELRTGFRSLGITGWKIRKDDMLNSASVVPTKRTFKLRKRERMQKHYVHRLVAHEIGVHVARYENGCLQPLKLFKTGFPGYLATEEGLAMYSEEVCGVLSKSIMRNYAGRVLAVNYALEGGFNEVYSNLLEFFDKNVAYKLAVRAKRGLFDTTDAGGFTKDYVYLKGYFDVKKFAKKSDVRDLYVGKIGVKDLSGIKKLRSIVQPKYIPGYFSK